MRAVVGKCVRGFPKVASTMLLAGHSSKLFGKEKS